MAVNVVAEVNGATESFEASWRDGQSSGSIEQIDVANCCLLLERFDCGDVLRPTSASIFDFHRL